MISYSLSPPPSFPQPSHESLRSSLKQMRQHCIENDVRHLAMPRIGCGLDKLNWTAVKATIQAVFGETDVALTVYSFT